VLRSRAHAWLPVALAAALQWLVIATASFLPFVDLPQHVAQAQLLLHMRDPAVASLYEAPIVPQVNVLGLLALAPALAGLPEAAAVRTVLALYVAGLAVALYRLTRALHTSAWTAAAALLFTIQFNLWYGFVSFCFGLPILVLMIARWATPDPAPEGAKASRREIAIEALLWWLLLLAHVLLFAFALAAFALWIGWGPRRSRRWRRGLATAPAFAWLLAFVIHSRAAMAEKVPPGGGVEAFWHGPRAKLGEWGRSLLVASQPGLVEWIVLGTAAIGVALCLALPSRRDDGATRTRRWLLALGALAVVAYIALPYSIYERERVTYGLFVLYPRFAVLAPLFLLPALSAPASHRVRRGLVIATAAAHIALAAHWSRVLSQVGHEAAPIDDAIAALEPGRILKSLVLTPFPAALRYDAFLHVASYYQARKLGESDQSFAALLPSPVHYRDPRRPYLSLQDEHLRPDDFDANRLRLYDYLLLYRRGGTATVGLPTVFARGDWRIEAVRVQAPR
jgi:hypothetical protein